MQLNSALSRLETADLRVMPAPGSQAESDVFDAATILFLEPQRGVAAKAALKAAMGGAAAELLTAFLAFIRTAHYWTVTHPELAIEDDMAQLLAANQQIADLLTNDPEAVRGVTSQRLVDEVVMLRRERDDREALREALSARAEALSHQQQLINELNHRVKNSLAIVQSIASQTLRRDDVRESTRDALTARLVALAQAHDLLTEENWQGADLHSILAAGGRVFAADDDARIQLSGPPIKLEPNQALALAMAVHELGTNATKYGALSNDSGRVVITWTVALGDAGARLNLVWREEGGPKVGKPQHRGFGARLVERGLAGDLNGVVVLSFEPSGVTCTIDAPLNKALVG